MKHIPVSRLYIEGCLTWCTSLAHNIARSLVGRDGVGTGGWRAWREGRLCVGGVGRGGVGSRREGDGVDWPYTMGGAAVCGVCRREAAEAVREEGGGGTVKLKKKNHHDVWISWEGRGNSAE